MERFNLFSGINGWVFVRRMKAREEKRVRIDMEIRMCEAELSAYLQSAGDNIRIETVELEDSDSRIRIKIDNMNVSVFIDDEECVILSEEYGIMWPYMLHHSLFLEQLNIYNIYIDNTQGYFIRIYDILEQSTVFSFKIEVNTIAQSVDAARSPTFKLIPKSFQIHCKRIQKEE